MMQPDAIPSMGDRGCGARLRQTREAAGLTQADVAARLKMPVRVVQSLETEDWGHLGAPVFVRGQLRSYSRLLGLTTAPMMQASGVAPIEPPVLKPRMYTPRLQRLGEQAARRLVYIVLTAAIAVPVWLATRPHLGGATTPSAPLDLPTGKRGFGNEGGSAATAVDAVDPATITASIAPLPSRPAATPALALSLRLRGDSWVQVIAPDGRPLEQSLLRAGEQRGYAFADVGHVVLGDATAVEVLRNGQLQDLAPYLRANVARFTVSSDGSLAPAVD